MNKHDVDSFQVVALTLFDLKRRGKVIIVCPYLMPSLQIGSRSANLAWSVSMERSFLQFESTCKRTLLALTRTWTSRKNILAIYDL